MSTTKTTPKRISLSEAAPELKNKRLTLAIPHTFGIDPAKPGVLLGLQLLAAGREAKGYGFFIDERTLETGLEVVAASGGKLKGYHTHDHSGPGTNYWAQDRSELDVAGYFSEIAIAAATKTATAQLVAGRYEFYDTFKADNKVQYERLMEMAAKTPELLGLSVEIWGYLVYVATDGVEYSQRPENIELANEGMPTLRITDFFAAAFVSDGAATSGLFAALGQRKDKGLAALKTLLVSLGLAAPAEGSPANNQDAADTPAPVVAPLTQPSATMKIIADLKAKFGSDQSKFSAAMAILGAAEKPDTLTVADIEAALGVKELADVRVQLGTATAEITTLKTQLGTKDTRIAELEKQVTALKAGGHVGGVNLGAGGGGAPVVEGNPYAAGSVNFSLQAKLEKTDPTRAAALKAEAAGGKAAPVTA